MIYIIEDNKDIAELIGHCLKKDNYQFKIFYNPLFALKEISADNPELILLDLMLPQMDGMSVCKHIRSQNETAKTPIIMLTAKGQEEDIVMGFEAGADDYVTKPFSPKVLLARISSVLRRSSFKTEKTNAGNIQNEKLDQELIRAPGLEINVSKREVYLLQNGERKKIDLTYTEFEVLCLLIQKPGRVFTRSQIVDAIKGPLHAVTDRSVDVQIVGLRKKLGNLDCIETIRGVGYRFKE